MRWVVAVVLIAACGGGESDDDVTVHAPAEAADVDFLASSITPGGDLVLWGKGSSSVVLVHSDDAWTALEPAPVDPLQHWASSYAVWASSLDDIWIGAWDWTGSTGPWLARWDGTSWTTPDADITGGPTLGGVFGIWGTGPDDVWLTGTRSDEPDVSVVFHWNGVDWTEHRPFVPTGPEDANEYSLGGGCSSSADDVWVLGSMIRSDDGWRIARTLHWNGATWEEGAVNVGLVVGSGHLACADDAVWGVFYDGEANDYDVFAQLVDGAWVDDVATVDNPDDFDAEFSGVAVAPDGSGWIAGRFPASPLLWHATEGEVDRVLSDGSDAGTLSTVAVAPDGTVWAAGNNGLIVETH